MEEHLGDTNSEPIILDFCNESVFIWDVHDVYKLRTEYRIVGKYVGCLPSLPRQDQLMGLPMELIPEEVFVLLTKGIAKLGEFKELNSSIDPMIVDERTNIHKNSFETQAVLFKEERKLQLTRVSDKIIEGKRKKYLKKTGQSEPFDETKALQEEVDKIPDMSEEVMMVQIFTRPHWNCKETQICPPTHQGIQRVKCLVFMDLWEKGYYMTSGEKFGGDFLVYPGDPVRFHSHYIAVCIDSEEKLSPYYIVSRGRLGTNVKKTVLLCSLTKCGKIQYQSLNWCGK